MSTKIYDLTYDFKQENGHFLVITGDGENSLHSDQLANIQVNMMKANTIDKLLSLHIEEMDFRVKLFYSITSKKMLSHLLREKRLTIHEFYQVLYHIVAAMDASKEYMLEEEQFVLHEDFIFIGKGIDDIYLTYLPLAQVAQKPPMKVEFRELLFKLVGYVQELSGDGVQQIANYLNDSSFHLAGLKEKLNDLRNNHTTGSTMAAAQAFANPSAQPAVHTEQPVAPAPSAGPVGTNTNQAAGVAAPPKEAPRKQKKKAAPPVQSGAKKSKPAAAKSTRSHAQAEVETKESDKQEGPSIIIVACLAILAMAGIWKVYMEMASEGMLYISAGLSLLVVAVAYYFAFVYKKGSGKKPVEQAVNKKAGKSGGKNASNNAAARNGASQQQAAGYNAPANAGSASVQGYSANGSAGQSNGYNANSASAQGQGYSASGAQQMQGQGFPASGGAAPGMTSSHGQQQAAATSNSDNYFSNLENQTTLLSQPDATVLLDEPDAKPDSAYLEVQRNGRQERIAINEDSFIIGRNPAAVQYVEDTVGVSRTHIEIRIQGDSFVVKDLGSKNGSKLNGEAMVAYKMYDLQNGDTVKVGTVEYTFRKGT